MKFYILKETYRGFDKGTVLLKGNEADLNLTDETGIEYFDITTEVTNGHSYSVYGVPAELLIPSGNDDQLSAAFKAFIGGNYQATQEIKELFKLRNI
jgi:hypothetical protein